MTVENLKPTAEALVEAYAEIGRLKAALRGLRAEIERLRNENAMLKADNAALRAALQGYMDWHRLESGDGGEVPLTEPAKSP